MTFLTRPPSLKSLSLRLNTLPSNIKIGDTIRINVVKFVSENTLLIRFKGLELLANTTIPLKEGDNLSGVVEQDGLNIILRIIAKKGEGQGEVDKLITLLRRYPPDGLDIGQELENILEHISNHPAKDSLLLLKEYIIDENSLEKGGGILQERITKVIEKSGLFLENRLTKGEMGDDLKSTLLKLAAHLGQRNIRDDTTLLETKIKALLSHIESNQSHNLLSSIKGNEQLIQLPYMIDGKVKNINIYIRDKEAAAKEGEKRNYSISIILDMEHINKIRVDINEVGGESVVLKIYLSEEKIQDIFESSKEELREGLKSLGIDASIDCFVADNNFINKEIDTEEYISDEHKLLDIRA